MTGRILYDLPMADYQALPALSAGGAWTLASECPALYWHTSPFNPNAAEPDTGGVLDIGTALHLAVLEPDVLERRIALVDAKDWRKQASRDTRDAAHAAGMVPLLIDDAALVARLSVLLRRNDFIAALLDGARTEVSYFWDANGVPCKARADIITHDGRAFGDLKASKSAAPQFFERQAFNAGHFLRSPWYTDGWQEVTGERAEYFYIVVAREAPNLITIARLDERANAWGRLKIRRALTLFEICRKQRRWPAYFEEPVTLSLPSWSEFRLADEEEQGRFDPAKITGADVRRGFDFLAP